MQNDDKNLNSKGYDDRDYDVRDYDDRDYDDRDYDDRDYDRRRRDMKSRDDRDYKRSDRSYSERSGSTSGSRSSAGGRGKAAARKKSNIGYWAIALVVEVILVFVLSYAIAKSYVHAKYSKLQINDIPHEELAIDEEIQETLKGYTSIALFGIDARDNSLGRGNRSDAIIVVSINNDTKEIRMTSVYRDTLLEIQKENPITAKVNTAYAYGGPEMAVQTLNANLDLNITEYATVNWEGLTRAIDALGGVEVDVEENELNTLNGVLAEQIASNGIYSDGVFTTGHLTLNGAQATAYSRIRSTDMGDITRTERQREVIGSMIDKLKKSDMKAINNLIDELFPYIATSITEKEMYDYAANLVNYEFVDNNGFPYKYGSWTSTEKGMCLVAQDLTENVKALHKFLYPDQNYTPSDNVTRINQILTNETGIASTGEVSVPSSSGE